MIATGGTVCLAEGIIDDTCLAFSYFLEHLSPQVPTQMAKALACEPGHASIQASKLEPGHPLLTAFS